jgi:hypothetical protein
MEQDWSHAVTSELVATLYGRPYANERFMQHAHSVSRRFEYAVYHYEEVLRLHDAFMQEHMKGRSYLKVRFGPIEGQAAMEAYIKAAQAHALALAQSVHSIPDIHAHTLYYALKLDDLPEALKARDLGAHRVRKLIQSRNELQALGDLCKAFLDSDEFTYLDGLVNISKHRSLVLAGFFEDLTGTREERHELRINAFKYKRQEGQRALKEVFPKLVNRCGAFVADTGNELHRILAARIAGRP